MCLYNPKKIETKGKPIKCYKVFKVYDNEVIDGEEPILHSPVYSEMTWKEGETKGIGQGGSGADFWEWGAVFNHLGSLCGGAFHTYATAEGAKTHVSRFSTFIGDNGHFVIYQCEIPATTDYLYAGDVYVREQKFKGYASQSLKIVKEVKSRRLIKR